MRCSSCGGETTTQEQVSYGGRCEDCFVDANPKAGAWYSEFLGTPSPDGKHRAVKGGREEVRSSAQYARATA